MIKNNLIKIYNNAINPDICQFIIDKFENSQNLVEGMSGGGVKKSDWLKQFPYFNEEINGWNQGSDGNNACKDHQPVRVFF